MWHNCSFVNHKKYWFTGNQYLANWFATLVLVLLGLLILPLVSINYPLQLFFIAILISGGILLYKYRQNPLFLIFAIAFAFLMSAFVLPAFPFQVEKQWFLGHVAEYVPQAFTVFVYIFGVLSIFLGFFIGNKLSFRIRWSAIKTNSRLNLTHLLWFLYFLCLFANIFQIVIIGKIPLFNILYRAKADAKIVFIASWQTVFLCALTVNSAVKKKKDYTPFFLLVSAVALALLGARNSPVKLLLCYMATMILLKRRMVRYVLFCALLGIILMFSVYLLSKSSIYGVPVDMVWVIQMPLTDSLGSFVYLEKVIDTCSSAGKFNGLILQNSIKAAIPGVSGRYANLLIGDLVGARGSSDISPGGVSIGSTFVGPPYADFGLIGVAGYLFPIGLLIGILHSISLHRKYYTYVTGVIIGTTAYAIYGGTLASDSIWFFAFGFAAVILHLIQIFHSL